MLFRAAKSDVIWAVPIALVGLGMTLIVYGPSSGNGAVEFIIISSGALLAVCGLLGFIALCFLV